MTHVYEMKPTVQGICKKSTLYKYFIFAEK